MDIPINLEDGEKLTELTQLNVIIHPFYRTRLFDPNHLEHTKKKRQDTLHNFLERMSPQSKSEATLIMPMTNEGGKSDLKSSIETAKTADIKPTFIDLYTEFVKQKGNGRNLILGTDLITDDRHWAPEAETIKSDLSKRGFQLTTNTQVVAGGELLNVCFLEGVENLLTIPEISRVKVDKRCVLTSDYLFGGSDQSVKSNFENFESRIRQDGFNIKNAEEYYLISRN